MSDEAIDKFIGEMQEYTLPPIERQAQPPARVVIRNNTPGHWNVVIRGAGVRFSHKDGSDHFVENKNLRVASGQSYEVYGLDEKCVKAILTVIVVQAPEGSQTLQTQEVAGNDECLVDVETILGQQKSAREGAKTLDLIELSVR